MLDLKSTANDKLKEVFLSNYLINEMIEDLQLFAESTGVLDTLDMLDKKTWEETPYNFSRANRLIWISSESRT
jgi:hypothetical protein